MYKKLVSRLEEKKKTYYKKVKKAHLISRKATL